MTTLELKITDNSILESVLKTLSKFNGVKIKKKKEYSEIGEGLISALEELDNFKKGKKELGDAKNLFKNL